MSRSCYDFCLLSKLGFVLRTSTSTKYEITSGAYVVRKHHLCLLPSREWLRELLDAHRDIVAQRPSRSYLGKHEHDSAIQDYWVIIPPPTIRSSNDSSAILKLALSFDTPRFPRSLRVGFKGSGACTGVAVRRMWCDADERSARSSPLRDSVATCGRTRRVLFGSDKGSSRLLFGGPWRLKHA